MTNATSITKLFLGKLKASANYYAAGENLFIEKHSWDCDWYWGFGYVGNKHCHFHFDLFLKNSETASELFEFTKITDKEWWIIRDLFKQAYSLRAAAEVYQYGGHQTYCKGVTDILKNADKAAQLNKDLEIVLDSVWDFMTEICQKRDGTF